MHGHENVKFRYETILAQTVLLPVGEIEIFCPPSLRL